LLQEKGAIATRGRLFYRIHSEKKKEAFFLNVKEDRRGVRSQCLVEESLLHGGKNSWYLAKKARVNSEEEKKGGNPETGNY